MVILQIQISYLLNMVSGADKNISNEAKKRFDKLTNDFGILKKTVSL